MRETPLQQQHGQDPDRWHQGGHGESRPSCPPDGANVAQQPHSPELVALSTRTPLPGVPLGTNTVSLVVGVDAAPNSHQST